MMVPICPKRSFVKSTQVNTQIVDTDVDDDDFVYFPYLFSRNHMPTYILVNYGTVF